MTWLETVYSWFFAIYQFATSVIASLTTAQGIVLFLFFLAIAPRVLLFLTGHIARIFKSPRLIVRAFNGQLGDKSNHLIVLVSGIRSPKILLRKTENVLRQNFDFADVLKLRIDNALFSNASPCEISSQISDLINTQYSRRAKHYRPYDKITIVCHSLGAILVRKAVLNASAGFGLGRTNFETRVAINDAAWRTKLDRIIMLGGINSGFDRLHTIWIHILTLLLGYMGIGRLIRALEKGKPFVETTRIEWINLLRMPHGSHAPITIQISGDDDWAIPENNELDLEAQINNEINPNHFAFEIGVTSHFSILDMALNDENELSLGSRRANFLIDAIRLEKNEINARALHIPRHEIAQELDKREKIKRIIFVYDDTNQKDLWLETVNQASARMFGKVDNIAISREIPPNLSRFSFLLNLFGRREHALAWFANKCTKLKAEYPNADLSIIAINNGTWIAATALRENIALQYQTLFLVGSILPREFAWDKIVKEGRLGLLCNTLAHEDLFCGAIGGFYQWLSRNLPIFGRLRCFELGDSGFGGFNWLGSTMGEIAYLEGTSNAFLESRSTIRFATAFAAFGGPIAAANTLATEGFNAITHETDPLSLDPNALITSDYTGNAAKAVKFLNRFAWGVGLALIVAICGSIFGLGILVYQFMPVYSAFAFLMPILIIFLILDSL